jgi:hypothetical protein
MVNQDVNDQIWHYRQLVEQRILQLHIQAEQLEQTIAYGKVALEAFIKRVLTLMPEAEFEMIWHPANDQPTLRIYAGDDETRRIELRNALAPHTFNLQNLGIWIHIVHRLEIDASQLETVPL